MVRGREDSKFIRLNNKAAQLELRNRPESFLFSLLEDPDEALTQLLVTGETQQIEFKMGICLNEIGTEDKKMVDKPLQAIASMMNSKEKGGYVLIGVADNGEIVGVEREFPVANKQKQNWDGWVLKLTNTIRDSFSLPDVYNYYSCTSHSIQGKTVCVIETTPPPKPVLFKGKLYIRTGPESPELKGADMVDFLLKWK